MGFTDVLRKSFPFISIAASMGGPLGVMAANVVGKAIGADKAPAPTQDAIANVIAGAIGDPAQRAALVKAEQDFQLQMAELGYKNAEDLEQIIDADRANARNREIQVRDWTPKLLAIAISTGFFSILGMMFFHKIPDAGHDARYPDTRYPDASRAATRYPDAKEALR